jgi:[amino group carrier protein]-lysine/ornithine hydrolase
VGIREWVPLQSEASQLLANLVSIPSPSGQERAAAGYLVEWLARRGLAAHVDEAGNAVGVKGSGSHEILLLGHIDTFPGDVPVRRDGQWLYGRGAVDAKGALCAFAATLVNLDVPHGWRVTVIGAVEEECATSKGARFVLKQRGSTAPIYCVVGEPSRWDRITLAYKGRLLLELELRAPFSHSAGPALLPAERGVDLWRAIENYCHDYNARHGAEGAFEMLTPSLRQIASQDTGAFGHVKLSVGFRLPGHIQPEQLQADVWQVLHQTAFGDDLAAEPVPGEPRPRPEAWTAARQNLELQCRFSGAEVAYRATKSNPMVRAFLGAIRQAGGKPRFVVKTGTSDMNVVGPRWPDTAIVAYGPGDSSLDHTPHEHIDLAEYERSILVLSTACSQLMTDQG